MVDWDALAALYKGRTPEPTAPAVPDEVASGTGDASGACQDCGVRVGPGVTHTWWCSWWDEHDDDIPF